MLILYLIGDLFVSRPLWFCLCLVIFSVLMILCCQVFVTSQVHKFDVCSQILVKMTYSWLGWLCNFIEQTRVGWTEAAMIAGAREVSVSPSIVGSFPRKEAALVEVKLWSMHPFALSVLEFILELANRMVWLLFPPPFQFSKYDFLPRGVKLTYRWLWNNSVLI